MKVASAFLMFCAFRLARGFKCMTCSASPSFDQCDARGEIKTCLHNEKSCETTVRRYNEKLLIWKGCKESNACKNNQAQNFAASGNPSQCNSDQSNSICCCCCEEDMCNAGVSCMREYHQNTPVRDCPQEPVSFPHGEVYCSKDHGAGSVCEYSCNEKDYSIWPKEQDTNVCLGNGTWAKETPCCARPCPPYFLADNTMLLYYAGEQVERILEAFKKSFVYGVIAEDALKISVMAFATEPLVSSVVRFDEYEANETKLRQLVNERLELPQGSGRFGVAMQYALDNMMKSEAGMRDNRVMKTLELHINVQPDDEAIEVAAKARERGYLVYVYGLELDEFRFDREQLAKITGDEDHVFIFKNVYGSLSPDDIADLVRHFCASPCNHVLHEHE